jgi:hypothetical protein
MIVTHIWRNLLAVTKHRRSWIQSKMHAEGSSRGSRKRDLMRGLLACASMLMVPLTIASSSASDDPARV